MRFGFGNVVVVNGDEVGVIVKSWDNKTHEVYVRVHNSIMTFHEQEIRHFIYDKIIERA